MCIINRKQGVLCTRWANERETNYGNTRRMLAQYQPVRFDPERLRLRLMHEGPRTGWRDR